MPLRSWSYWRWASCMRVRFRYMDIGPGRSVVTSFVNYSYRETRGWAYC